VWEKIAEGLQAAWSTFPDEQQQRIADAVAAGMRKVALQQSGAQLPDDLAATLEQADREVFSLLRAAVGLDDLDAANVGSAPCPEGVITFFHAIGVPLSELWGMTETAAGGTVNPAHRIRVGTVGLPAPGVELRIASDGEVFIRGAMVTRGYRNLPEATAAAIDSDGWLHTGDLGALDDDGYLRIIGRKKELIVNSYGKNMSPALIQGVLTASSPLIAHAVAIGDRRPYNVALIVLEPTAASKPLLADRGTLTEAVKTALESANTKLSNVERIKRFHILGEEWLPGSDQLTSTMKLRRANVVSRYSDVIDAIYDGTIGTEVNR
jgi:long-subunit acyl-CoA synthetase (AMP-forming)